MRSGKDLIENTECIFLEDGESLELKMKNGEIYEKIKKVCFDKDNKKITFKFIKSSKYESKEKPSLTFGIDDLSKIDYLRWDMD